MKNWKEVPSQPVKLADSMWDLKVLVVLRKRIIITSKVDADEP